MDNSREKAITRTSIIGIIANIFLSAFKAMVGLLAGSIAIVLDSVNNLTDALSSVITIVGIKLAKKTPDKDHPFGYGRIEYFSTIIISFIILLAGGSSIIESIKKVISPVMPDYSAVTIIIIVASIIIKLVLSRYVKAQGIKFNSDALVASGADAGFDAIISIATLISAIIAMVFGFSIDGIVGAIIAIFIIKAGIEMLGESVGNIIGKRTDSEITKNIKARVREIPGVLGAYDLVLHNYGPESAMGSIHVEIQADMTGSEIHNLTKTIQKVLLEEYHLFVTVGIYAVETKDSEIVAMRQKIRDICLAHEGTLNVHGIYINRDEKYISFDATVDFTVRGKQEYCEIVRQEITAEYSGYTVEINLDTNYSD